MKSMCIIPKRLRYWPYRTPALMPGKSSRPQQLDRTAILSSTFHPPPPCSSALSESVSLLACILHCVYVARAMCPDMCVEYHCNEVPTMARARVVTDSDSVSVDSLGHRYTELN